ncbi:MULTISPECIES: PTS sugar transporter subunit IIA [unclassified Rathayibacter]|uniref:PTS sugar transporter subunit IIA n=1 Tax=unclassified Rathayibacter TaxID=2609250 RepID=UPI00188D3623|nr:MULTISPECIES: PTS sugar transporter subunit IIA [unclassified Rathayibacter]MBF4461861.1 PTS sugar transporter subunit IIA [Rathayibacter sp. VKM Ac-2879]MBF4503274.1 PTS sugar transporter subunit IIA [Rathayibacter sp. VKM Ac-2878]
MPLKPLPGSAVALQHPAATWREAVLAAGRGLERCGAVDPAYSRRMIEQIDVLGPYIVIAPGLALAHARPGNDVLADGLSVVTLARPVPFGHAANDPVSVVIGIASTRAHGHLGVVAGLADVLSRPDAVAALAAARTVRGVNAVLTDGVRHE